MEGEWGDDGAVVFTESFGDWGAFAGASVVESDANVCAPCAPLTIRGNLLWVANILACFPFVDGVGVEDGGMPDVLPSWVLTEIKVEEEFPMFGGCFDTAKDVFDPDRVAKLDAMCIEIVTDEFDVGAEWDATFVLHPWRRGADVVAAVAEPVPGTPLWRLGVADRTLGRDERVALFALDPELLGVPEFEIRVEAIDVFERMCQVGFDLRWLPANGCVVMIVDLVDFELHVERASGEDLVLRRDQREVR